MTWKELSILIISFGTFAAAACPPKTQYSGCLNPLLKGTDPHHFLKKVLMTIDYDRFMGMCRDYQLMKMCAEQYLIECEEERARHDQTFLTADKIMAVLCDSDAGYRPNMVCIVSQRNGLLSQRCDKIYGLRKLSGGQDSQYYCSLLGDLFICKDRLIRSACGHAAADAWFKLNSIIYSKKISTHQCHLSLKHRKSDAFQYSTPCPPTFPGSLAFCSETFIRAAPSVYSHLPVVINGDSSDVDKMCSAQSQYQDCISSIVQTCPAGTKYIEDTFHWNVKHELASYMCSEKTAYKAHLACYKTLAKLKIQDEKRDCFETRVETVQLLRNYYLYACNKSSQHNVTYMRRKSNELIACLTHLTLDHCGSQAASVIKPLLQTKFGLGQFRMRCDGTVLDITIPAQRNDRAKPAATAGKPTNEGSASKTTRLYPNLLFILLIWLIS